MLTLVYREVHSVLKRSISGELLHLFLPCDYVRPAQFQSHVSRTRNERPDRRRLISCFGLLCCRYRSCLPPGRRAEEEGRSRRTRGPSRLPSSCPTGRHRRSSKASCCQSVVPQGGAVAACHACEVSRCAEGVGALTGFVRDQSRQGSRTGVARDYDTDPISRAYTTANTFSGLSGM